MSHNFTNLGNISNILRYVYGRKICEAKLPRVNGNVVRKQEISEEKGFWCTRLGANTMWRKLLYSGFETCFGPSTQGAGIRYQNTSQIQILRHFEKKGRGVNF